jgi:L-serine dehydratase
MFISVFDIFKIGIGPSSSHTMGPMVAAARFLDELKKREGEAAARLGARLHGSLAFTGRGHATDRAVIFGLAGLTPETLDPDKADDLIAKVETEKRLQPPGLRPFAFDPERDLVFDFGDPLPGHANGMKLFAYDEIGEMLIERTYYSIGGGFVAEPEELDAIQDEGVAGDLEAAPYPFKTAKEMLEMGRASGLSVVEMKRANEKAIRSAAEVERGLERIWTTMKDCMERGMQADGLLPGGLKVRRRAKALRDKLKEEMASNAKPPHQVNDWIALYAMAVNEENAAGGRIVTAPTNGAAGVVPAVIRYYLEFCPGARKEDVGDFLLAAAAIGGLIKHNASISGAEVGCQGEVGSASAMAAAGLCAALGGANEQVENAAEIALEHHLGMTCDPIKGLVQVPCIERNGFGAVKAVTAASLALKGDGSHLVPLDQCVETMRQTGLDMSNKYKETSTGGLAVNVVEC